MKRLTPILIFFLLSVTAGAEPQPLTSDHIHGTGDGQDVYYTFTAGPGMVIVRADAMLRPESDDAVLTVELLDAAEQSLAAAVVGEVGDPVQQALRKALTDLLSDIAAPQPVLKRKAVRAKLEEAQTVMLRVRAGTGVSQYNVNLQGPIVLGNADVTVDEPVEESEGSEGSDQPAEVTEEEAPPQTEDVVVEEAPPVPPKKLKIPGKKTSTSESKTSESKTGESKTSDSTTSESKPPAVIQKSSPKMTKVPKKLPVIKKGGQSNG